MFKSIFALIACVFMLSSPMFTLENVNNVPFLAEKKATRPKHDRRIHINAGDVKICLDGILVRKRSHIYYIRNLRTNGSGFFIFKSDIIAEITN